MEVIKKTEFIKSPPMGIIFTDLDGVWFDESRNFAAPPSKDLEVIKEAEKNGYLFILNSDTGGDALFEFGDQLGIKSDIVIAEGGAYIQKRDGNREFLIDKEIKNQIDALKLKLTELFTSQNRYFYAGDATAFIRNTQLPLNSVPYPFYLINLSRICSLGIYTRKVVQGNMTVDDNLTEDMLLLLSNFIGNSSPLKVKKYPSIGSCLVKSNPPPEKSSAVKRFLEVTGYQGPCYMIGDRISDSMSLLTNQVKLCAVGNAEDQLKTQADFVTPSELQISKGAAYIVKQIINSKI